MPRGAGRFLRGVATGVLPALAAAAAVLVGRAGPTARAASLAPAPPRHVILVGLDAADWLAIDPLVAKGALPTFARLEAVGRTGVMLSTPPLLSPIIWTTIATGRTPDDHGVLDFMVDLPSGGQAPVSARERRVPALWNLFSAAGRRVAVVGWWATWPAEAVRGTIVSDRVAPQLARPGATAGADLVSPASDGPRLLASVVRASDLSRHDLAAYLPVSPAEYGRARAAAAGEGSLLYRDPLAHLAAVVAGTRTYSAIAERLAASSPDLLAVYLEEIDTVSHRFVRDRRGAGAIARAYADADALIAALAARAPKDALVIVCSDHGFQPADAGVVEDPADLAGPAEAWHRPYGIIAIAAAGDLAGITGTGTGTGTSRVTVDPLDIAPTVLHAAGLPVPREMPGHVALALLPEDVARRPVPRAPTPAWTPLPEAPRALTAADADTTARLKALGYISAAGGTSLGRLHLGEVLYRRGKLEAAERAFRGVVERQPDDLTARLWLARTLRDLGRSHEAVVAYEEALRLPGEAGEARVEATELAAGAGLLDDADRIAATGRADAPDRLTALAVVSRARGDAAGAERRLRAALARDPAFFPALSRLFDLLGAAHRAAETVPPARAGVARAPRSPRHLALLGAALLAAGDAGSAEAPLAAAVSLAPDAPSVRIDLARAQLGRRDAGRALATLSGVPESVERHILAGAAFSLQSRWAEAAREYAAAMAAEGPAGERPDLLNGLGWARLQEGRRPEAADLFSRSLAKDANQPEIRRLLDGLPRPAPGH